VHVVALRGQLAPSDGAVEVIDIAIDLQGPAPRSDQDDVDSAD
jgi:hypothetical protein